MARKQAKQTSHAKARARSKKVTLPDLQPSVADAVKGGDTNTAKTTKTSTDTQEYFKVTLTDVLISG